MLKISKNGINIIKRFEGCQLQGYICPAGIPTIGYGYTGKINGKTINTNTFITQGQADDLLSADLERFESHVMKFDSVYNWNQNEFDALVSFAYNVGSINNLTQNKKRTKAQIAKAMLKYNKANGKVLAGLTKRRLAEQELFLAPIVKEEDEVVTKGKVIIDKKEITVDLILKDGHNYVKLRDVAPTMGYDISAKGSTPVLSKK